ncbi:hypothetical protein OQA88_9768 [Cercophora sp. LCS_1]
MSDIDDELLALAGGDVSSDEEEPMDMSRDGSRSPSPQPTASRKKDTLAKGVAVKKASAKPAKRRSRDDESEDEGEASDVPSSPASQQSVPMDESDDSDAPQSKPRGGDDDPNQYPVDGLFRDYDEKEHIMGMREIEREQILAERREENERIRQNRMLRQLKVNQEKDFKKRKASAADLEDDRRKTARVRTKIGETSEKMDTLRRAREERSSRKEQRERENDRRKQPSPSFRHGSHDNVDSDVEWMSPNKSKPRSRTPEPRESLPADLRDFERIRVGRTRFAEVCFYPGFEQAITGCYVRVNIGPDPEKGQDVYRFTQGRAYAVSDQTGKPMVVDMYVKCAHGKAAEFERYKKVCAAEDVPFPNRNTLVDKIDDINGLVKRKWTEAELSEKLKRQNTLHAKYSGTERDQVAKQLELARIRGDQEAIKRLQEKLDSIEVPRLAWKTSLTPQKNENKGLSQQERLAALNLENRRRNTEAVRQAQLRERAKARELQAARKERGEALEETIGNGSAVATPARSVGDATTPKQKGTPTILPHIAKLQEQQRSQTKNGMPTIHAPLMDDDVIGALDLDIDVEID